MRKGNTPMGNLSHSQEMKKAYGGKSQGAKQSESLSNQKKISREHEAIATGI